MEKKTDGRQAGEDKDKKPDDGMMHAGMTGAAADTVQRYGSAVKEHVVAYSGKDNETGQELKKSLSKIFKHKLSEDPNQAKINLKQQAGFAAEVKGTARTNAERAIDGNPIRRTRTDDIGRVNDPYYDHVDIDPMGREIAGTGSQMKFVGETPREAWVKIHGTKFQKYHEAGVPIEVPSDYFEGIKGEIDKDINSLRRQIETLEEQGKLELAQQKREQIRQYEKIKANLKKSNVASQEAMEARLDPKLSTLKDIGSLSHRAGMEAGKMGAAIGGGVAIVQNVYLLAKGDIEFAAAAKNVAATTVKGAAAGYATGFCGSAMKGLMQNAGSSSARALARTNLPGIVVSVAMETSKTMLRFFKGEITGTQCLNELGQKGTGMVSSAMFTAVGQAAIPIPVVGGLIGGMVGYAISTASYGILTQALTEAALAKEERARIERECAEHVRMLREFRMQVQETINRYMSHHMEMFTSAFEGIKDALEVGDIDGFIASSNAITRGLGKKANFETMDEFEVFMDSGDTFKF